MTQQADSNLLDKARPVRSGEELDIEAVHEWLGRAVSSPEARPAVTQYSGGASNWTYCLDYPDRSLILRRAPKGTKSKGAHDMAREYALQSALAPVFSRVPKMVAFCDDPEVIGSDFYVMEKLVGVIPRKNFPKGLAVTPEQNRRLCKNFFDCLIELHSAETTGTDLAQFGKDTGYIERQISGWANRYQNAKTWNVPSGKRVIRWLEQNIPQQVGNCLIHNDFRLDNLVLDKSDYPNILGVLDWELATLGDPLMDLGNTLAYWVEAGDDFFLRSTRRQPTNLDGMFTRQDAIEYYCSKTGHDASNFTFYQVYGMFRLAGIIQQIYYRYNKGQSQNPAFKNFWFFNNYLIWRCNRTIRNSA